MFDKEIGDT